jgi:hypothetical protein
MRETVGADTPNIRAIWAAVFLPDITASGISRRLISSSFLRRPTHVRFRIMARSNWAVCGALHTADDAERMIMGVTPPESRSDLASDGLTLRLMPGGGEGFSTCAGH